jgi:hypothetical protein
MPRDQCKRATTQQRPDASRQGAFTADAIADLRIIFNWLWPGTHSKSHPEIKLSTIKYTIRRERDRTDCKSLPRSGAPRKLTEDKRDEIYEMVQEDPDVSHQ